MKVAIITDTNSGMTAEDAASHGIFLEAMPVIIDGKEYLEGETLDSDHFYRMLEDGAVVQTSQPAAGDVIDLWKSVLRDYDEIVHIPMSSGLSGSCQSAMLYAQEFDGRVHVVDNQRISVTQRQSALDAKVMAESGMNGSEIKALLEKTKAESHIYIMVDTLTYLKKGGRITPAAALVGSVLNLKPVLQIQGDKLDAFSKCRGIRNAKKIMTDAVADGIEHEFGGISYDGAPGAWIGIAHTRNEAAALAYADETRKRFPGFDVYVDRLPISIACHIGPGSLALTCTKVLPEGVGYTDSKRSYTR